MPNLVCRNCGRVVHTTAPLDTLSADERRCSRCGGMLTGERRGEDRRRVERRQNPPDNPGPPGGIDRRVADRRRAQRRGDDGGSVGGA